MSEPEANNKCFENSEKLTKLTIFLWSEYSYIFSKFEFILSLNKQTLLSNPPDRRSEPKRGCEKSILLTGPTCSLISELLCRPLLLVVNISIAPLSVPIPIFLP